MWNSAVPCQLAIFKQTVSQQFWGGRGVSGGWSSSGLSGSLFSCLCEVTFASPGSASPVPPVFTYYLNLLSPLPLLSLPCSMWSTPRSLLVQSLSWKVLVGRVWRASGYLGEGEPADAYESEPAESAPGLATHTVGLSHLPVRPMLRGSPDHSHQTPPCLDPPSSHTVQCHMGLNHWLSPPSVHFQNPKGLCLSCCLRVVCRFCRPVYFSGGVQGGEKPVLLPLTSQDRKARVVSSETRIRL